jgi:GTP-binding protein HflX
VLTEFSAEVQRQVGLLIDRRGHVREAIVGDARSVFLPDLSKYRRGKDRLCGLRLVHTHLRGEALNDDDFTDLALLRLDMIAAVEVLEGGLPGKVFVAHMAPGKNTDTPWEVLPPVPVHDLEDDFLDQMDALEEEFARQRGPHKKGAQKERAILIHVSQASPAEADDSLEELKELVRSAGIEVAEAVRQRRAMDPKFVMGKGKLKHTIIRAMQLGAEVLVFDKNLSPGQVPSLAGFTDLKILDRTQIILDIFAQRAQTREGKIQVELAQLRYMLPRLGAKQTMSAFSRLTGGIGGRGPGETKLEIDRRRAGDRIAQLEREVGKLGKRRTLRRSKREQNNVPVVSIVGYTNAGKSTLLNQLTKSDVTAENALFATLNPVSRRLRFPKEREIVITDTVGFIRDLPKELMAAFRTTLEELYHADLLLHVMDASSPYVDEQFDAVRAVLTELGLDSKPTLIVLNKSDRCAEGVLQGLMKRHDGVPLCALDATTFAPLLERLETDLWPATLHA